MIIFTIISSIALVLSGVSIFIWWKDADYWMITRADIVYLKKEVEKLNQNNRRCITCKYRRDRMCPL